MSPSDYLDLCDDLNRRRDCIQARARRQEFLLRAWAHPAAFLLGMLRAEALFARLLAHTVARAQAIEQRRKDDLLELLDLYEAADPHRHAERLG